MCTQSAQCSNIPPSIQTTEREIQEEDCECCTTEPVGQHAVAQLSGDSCSCCSSGENLNDHTHGHEHNPEQDECSCCSTHNIAQLAPEVANLRTTDMGASQSSSTACECCMEGRHYAAKQQYGSAASRLQFADESCCQSPCCKLYSRRKNRRFNRARFFWPRNRPIVRCCTGSDIIRFQRLPEPQATEEVEKDLTLAIMGMDCPACTVRVERALRGLGTTEVKVDFVGAFASCKYISDELHPELIRKKVETATGFRCSVARRRNGQRTLRIRFPATNTPKLQIIQSLFSPTQEVLHVSRTDFRFVITNTNCRQIHSTLASQDWPFQPINDDEEELSQETIARDLKISLFRFCASIILTIPVLVLAWSPGYNNELTVRGGISLGLSTFVIIGGARQIIFSAARCLIVDHELDADVLISLSTLTAYIYSVVSYSYNIATATRTLESYFETVTLLVTLILLGRLVAVYTRKAAARSFAGLSGREQIDTAQLADGTSIHTTLLDVGDVITVKASQAIASDGIVTTGRADVDESLMTGEALPVTKSRGTFVLAGTRVVVGEIQVRLAKCVQDNSLAELHRLTNEARSSRAPVQDAADRVARYLVPLVLFVSAVCLITWTLVYKLQQRRSTGSSLADSLSYAVAVLALSCPCALALCVPLVVLYAKNACQAKGLLFKSSAALQTTHKATHVIFDKTGTLTTGRLRVAEAHYEDDSFQPVVLALVNGSEHPVSAAIASHLSSLTSDIKLSDVEAISGKGIQAVYNGEIIQGGNATWCEVKGHPVVVRMLGEGRSIFVVVKNKLLCAAFSLEDDLRPETVEVIQSLLSAGKQVSILSGDHQGAVDALVARMGFSSNITLEARGDCSPDDKKVAVRMASWGSSCEQEDSEKGEVTPPSKTNSKDIVVFVGDGSNDTAALSQADVGISMSSGSSLALGSADIVILSGGLNGVREAMRMSKKSWRRIVFGLGWSLLYNTLAIIFGSGMLVRVRVAPQWAGLGELASLLPLVLIAQSLRFWF